MTSPVAVTVQRPPPTKGRRGGEEERGEASSPRANPGAGLVLLPTPRQEPAAACRGRGSHRRPWTWAAARGLVPVPERGLGEERVRTGPGPAQAPRGRAGLTLLVGQIAPWVSANKKKICVPVGKPLDTAMPRLSPL